MDPTAASSRDDHDSTRDHVPVRV